MKSGGLKPLEGVWGFIIYLINQFSCAEFSDTNDKGKTPKKYSSTDLKDLNTADMTQRDFW